VNERDPLDDLPWPSPPEPGLTVTQKIHKSCTGQLGSKQCASARRRALLSLLVPVITVGAFSYLAIFVRKVPDDGALRAALYGALGWSAVLGATLLVGLASPPGKRPRAAVRWAIAVAIPLVFFVYLAVTALRSVPFGVFAEGAMAEHAVRCGAICFAVGAIMSSGVMLLWRGTDPLTPGLSGALVGLVGGMGSALGMGVFCPSHEAWHLFISHGVVLASLALLGAAAGRRLLAP
jgi:hypothetical protein